MKVTPKECTKHGFVLTQMWTAESRGGSDKPGRIWVHRTAESALRHYVHLTALGEEEAGLKILNPNGGSLVGESARVTLDQFRVVFEETKKIREILIRADALTQKVMGYSLSKMTKRQEVLKKAGIRLVTPFFERGEGSQKQGTQDGLDLVDPDPQEITAEQKDQYVLIKRTFEPVGGKEKGQEVIIPKGDPIKAFLTGIEQINQDNETLTLYRIRNGKSESIRSTSSGIMQQKEGA